jgi:2-polyprenyl-3-methyl-5-hydroxy-6-metoxy-1,4-benzoquinol methylase
MPIVNQHFQLEHGLQIEETHEAGDQVGVQHLFRYWYAWAYIEKVLKSRSIVWDLGCGSGFGVRIMAEEHPGTHVHGVDIDAAALGCGKILCDDVKNVSFAEHDLDGHWWPYVKSGKNHPQLLVCYDVLTFLKHRDAFLLGLAGAARNNYSDVLFSTTPPENKWFVSEPRWREKQCEMSASFARDLLGKFFEKVTWLGQDDFPLADYVKKVTDYTGYPVGEDIIVCTDARKS